ncbi:MAG: preprotein translocase subunit SecG [Clostridiales bacterium]|nr:preprotein translocase subunit SecG [Clostridiales bacterium]
MNTLAVVLTCVDIVVCIALIILVMSQEGNDRGMGVVGGSGNSFYEKSKGRTMDEKLKKITLFTAVLFAILTIVLFLVLARGF